MNVLEKGDGRLMSDPDPDRIREFFRSKKVKRGSKLMSASEAVATYVRDGCYVASGGFGANRISTILLHEVIRQGKRDLGFAGHTTTHDFQLLCAGRCLNRCDAAYIVGLEARGLSRNARR